MPRYARVPASAVAAAQATLSSVDERARRLALEARDRLAAGQGPLCEYLASRLRESLDERALSLGRMLTVGVFMAFEGAAAAPLETADVDAVAAADASLAADEELRRADPLDPLESEDIVAIEQPALVGFVNDHVARVLEAYAESIDVDDVAAVFRAILVEIIALSHAVRRPPGYPADYGREPSA